MTTSQLISRSRLLLTCLIALLLLAAPQLSQAAPVSATPSLTTAPDQAGIRIKIIIIIVIKKKGIAEISEIRAATERVDLKENMIFAEAELRGNQFLIMPLRTGFEAGKLQTLLMPAGLRVPANVAAKLEAPGPFALKAGKMDFKVNSLGNFEIQD